MKTFPRPRAALLALAALSLGFTSNGRASTTEPLPDSTVLLRVDGRLTRVSDFVRAYFVTWPEDRPKPDSAGRAEFLNRLVQKEILGIAARQAARPLGFEDRLVLREHRQRALSNALYQRLVIDSVVVTEQDVRDLQADYACEKRLKHIQFDDFATAEKVRADLIAKRITWARAHRQYSKAVNDSGPEGDWGWRSRTQFELEFAPLIFDPEPGEITRPYRDPDGVQLVLIAARRPAEPPQIARYDHLMRKEVRNRKINERMDRIHEMLREQARMTADEENIAWAAGHFEAPPPLVDASGTLRLTAHARVPRFAPQDTSRVLIRWNGGHLSLSSFMREYQATTMLMRQAVNTPDLMRARAMTMALEPFRARLAIEKGLEQDPMVVAEMNRKEEEILVGHLYQDSIASRVFVPAAERRKYYDKNATQFYTYPASTYGVMRVATRERADSLAARLRAGEKIYDLMRADSIQFGRRVGAIRQFTTQDEGRDFYKLIMEELKPGQTAVEPAPEGPGFWLIQVLAFDAGRQMTFRETETTIAESLENLMAERLLKEFLERRGRALRIESHPELLMRVDLTPPSVNRETS